MMTNELDKQHWNVAVLLDNIYLDLAAITSKIFYVHKSENLIEPMNFIRFDTQINAHTRNDFLL